MATTEPLAFRVHLPGHLRRRSAHHHGMTTSTAPAPSTPTANQAEPVSAHAGHEVSDVSISWGGYEYCVPCREVLAIENYEGDVVWQAGRDTVADCRHYLGDSMTNNGLTAATAS